ncbi:lipopolysaccharide biosynthesis protein [Mycobacterium sp. AMU20-3851]|uniref:lipopolysaccharide biosynthesis protein n=1 Tax=Mycobacterium sp. AMU20-3851 TaxID=3122055 RepID=UPI00375491D1
MATSATLSQLLFIACTPVLTRLYSPDDFGVLAVFVSILGLVPVVASFRYDIAISLSVDRQESFHTLALCLFGSVLCTAAVVAVFGSGLLANTEFVQLQPYWWLVAVGTLAVGVFSALNAWVGYAQQFELVARVKVKQAVSSVAAQIGLGLLTVGPLGLLVGYVISQFYGATSFALAVWRARPQWFTARDVWAAACKYRRFFFFAFPAGIVNRLGIHIVPVLFGYFYSLPTAGFFLLAQRLVALPTMVIGTSVAQVYTNRLAKDSLTGRTLLLPTYIKTVLVLLAAGLVPMGLLVALAPWLFGLVFGDEWRLAGEFCQILVPAFYAQFVVSPMIQTLNVLGYQMAQLIWDSIRLAAIVAAFVVASRLGHSEVAAVVAVSTTLCAMYILQFLLSVWAIRRHDKRIQV